MITSLRVETNIVKCLFESLGTICCVAVLLQLLLLVLIEMSRCLTLNMYRVGGGGGREGEELYIKPRETIREI